MGVGVHGSGDVGMADAGLDSFHVDASFDHHGGAAVAKIMEADLLQTMLLHETFPLLSHRLRSEGLAVGLADHKTGVGKAQTHGQFMAVVLRSGQLQFSQNVSTYCYITGTGSALVFTLPSAMTVLD